MTLPENNYSFAPSQAIPIFFRMLPFSFLPLFIRHSFPDKKVTLCACSLVRLVVFSSLVHLFVQLSSHHADSLSFRSILIVSLSGRMFFSTVSEMGQRKGIRGLLY